MFLGRFGSIYFDKHFGLGLSKHFVLQDLFLKMDNFDMFHSSFIVKMLQNKL